MKYLFPLLVLLTSCGSSHLCQNSKLLGLWYQNAAGPTYWFQEDCSVKLNNCKGFNYGDYGTHVQIQVASEFDAAFCSHTRFPLPVYPPADLAYSISGSTLTISNQDFIKFR